MHMGEKMGTLRRLGTLVGAGTLVLGVLTVGVATTSTAACR